MMGNLLSIWFGFSILILFPSWLFLCAANFLLSKSGIFLVSGCLYAFSSTNSSLSISSSPDFLLSDSSLSDSLASVIKTL